VTEPDTGKVDFLYAYGHASTVAVAAGVLSFDVEAALRYGVVSAAQESKGRRMSFGDAQIAAVRLSVGATLATRNTENFEGLGLDFLNPWAS